MLALQILFLLWALGAVFWGCLAILFIGDEQPFADYTPLQRGLLAAVLVVMWPMILNEMYWNYHDRKYSTLRDGEHTATE